MMQKTLFVSSALTFAGVQAAFAHPSLSPHAHPLSGTMYVSFLEIAAGLCAAALVIGIYRFRQAQLKSEKARRK